MENSQKLETLEELELMKGKLTQSIANVRDQLLNMGLPSSEVATVMANLGSSDEQKITTKTTSAPSPNAAPAKSAQGKKKEAVSRGQKEVPPEPKPELSLEEALFMPELEFPMENERLEEPGRVSTEVSQSTPQVNLLSNLMQWVAKAKQEIGAEQLPTLLEFYGISGHLSPELKEVILHLGDITSGQSEGTNNAESWVQLMLSLHGILTGGDAPLHPPKPLWNNGANELPSDEAEVLRAERDQPKDEPLKLKLVLPDSAGRSREFCLELKPKMDSNGS